MTIPMFVNEDDHYEYMREKYEAEDTEEESEWRIQFDGFTDGEADTP